MTFIASVLRQFNWAASLTPWVPWVLGVGKWLEGLALLSGPGPCLTLYSSTSLSIRSSDSEEAFETPESTTPVKAPPAPPPPPPEVIPEPEISTQPPLEEPGNQGSGTPREQPWAGPLGDSQLEEGVPGADPGAGSPAAQASLCWAAFHE